jgi:hypothetical protein
MLLFIAFLLFFALFVAWMAAPSSDSAGQASTSPDVAMPVVRSHAA